MVALRADHEPDLAAEYGKADLPLVAAVRNRLGRCTFCWAPTHTETSVCAYTEDGALLWVDDVHMCKLHCYLGLGSMLGAEPDVEPAKPVSDYQRLLSGAFLSR